MRLRTASVNGSVTNAIWRTWVLVLHPLISTSTASMPSAEVPLIRPIASFFCLCIFAQHCHAPPFRSEGYCKTLGQHRTIPALRLKHRFGGCGTASALPKCSIMSGCGTHIVLRGQKPLALCDRCPCFGSLFPPLAALTFAASSIICAFGLAAAAPRSPYRHLELCGIALEILYKNTLNFFETKFLKPLFFFIITRI